MTRALVTGAGGRLGQAMAVELARQGYDVAVHFAGSRDGATDTVAQIAALGQQAVPLQADLLDDAETQALFTRAIEALGGPITCLINNASIFEYDTIHTATRESWDRHMGSNLRAPLLLTQAMAGQGGCGLVVNMIDQRVRKLTPEFMTYTLAKMGLWTLTRTTAQALAPAIRVNAIGPGPTLQGARQSADHFARQRAALPLDAGPDPEDICAALRYLLEARSVTGQLICVDGGQHLAWQTPDVLGPE